MRLMYANDNKVFIWGETSASIEQLPLPEDALGPVISDDGRFVAFTTQGQAVDTPQRPVEGIPLRLFDTQTGTTTELDVLSTVDVRERYPESPQIYLQMEWLPGGHMLVAQVYPYPWGSGILQPTGPLYLVDAESGSSQQILPSGAYERYTIRPDGLQIAALDSGLFAADRPGDQWDQEVYQRGTLHLIDLPGGTVTRSIPVRLPADPWGFTDPVYSPDSTRLAFSVESGIAIVNVEQGVMVEAPVQNTCLAENECFWTDSLPVIWLPDGNSFYTLQSINDYFDERAETTLSRVYVDRAVQVETIAVIRANQTITFSPDRSVLTYWNQPDIDRLEQGIGDMNRVTLYLMDVEEGEPHRYIEAYVLRVMGWHADNQRFLYYYSPRGGPNPVTSQLAVGNICQPPQELSEPPNTIVNRAHWLRGDRFLVWTLPADGIPNRWVSGLYLYDLAKGSEPVHIGDLLQNGEDPYGLQDQVVILRD